MSNQLTIQALSDEWMMMIEAIHAMTKLSSDDYFTDYLPRVKRNEIAKQVKCFVRRAVYRFVASVS